MARTKRGVISRAKHNKVLKSVKGQRGRRKNTIRIARQAMEKAMQYAYRDRKAKKREFRSLWIQRINAGVRAEGLTYAKFITKGNKVKFTVKFKGREMQHTDLGKDLMNKIIEETKDVAKVETKPKFEGRQMIMIIQPL